MRRIFRLRPLELSRYLVVGPSTTLPSAEATPQFGRRRRRRMQNDVQRRVYDPAHDGEAKSVCFERYGFVQKPLFMETWQEFLSELRRVELGWSLAPGAGGTLQLTVHDHWKLGEEVLCKLSGATNRSTPLADFFEVCGSLTQGAIQKGEVSFADGDNCLSLLIEGKQRIGDIPFQDEPPIVPHICQFNCRGLSVSLSVIDKKTLVRTPLFSEISIQTLNYAFMTSLPLFLKRTDIGVRNADFVTKDNMRHFRFAWCFLRKESRMTPVALGELDTLLPP